MAKAHAFFTSVIESWLDEDDSAVRASNLVGAVTTQLQLVAIELQYDEDAQEIFETLNARGYSPSHLPTSSRTSCSSASNSAQSVRRPPTSPTGLTSRRRSGRRR